MRADLPVGSHPCGDYWPVGLDNPYTKERVADLKLCDSSLSTSGNMPSHPRHIINPQTGHYVEDRRMVSVIADDPVAKFYANKREDFAGKFSVAYLHKDPEYFGFCVRKGETELVKRINKAIAAMKADGTEDKLKIKWMGSAD